MVLKNTTKVRSHRAIGVRPVFDAMNSGMMIATPIHIPVLRSAVLAVSVRILCLYTMFDGCGKSTPK